MRLTYLALTTLVSTGMAGCATFKPPQISYDDERPAVLEGEPPQPVQVVEMPKPLPLPGQLKPLPGARSKPEPRDPRQRVDLANAAARIQPVRSGYLNAMQVYPFVDGALYQVYSAPGQVPTSPCRTASSSSAPDRLPPATPCDGSLVTPKAGPQRRRRFMSSSSRAGQT